MIGSKFAKAFILGMCITVFSSSVAFANTGGGQPAVVQGQQPDGENSLLKKQKEIDQYVFEQHAKEIADKGFKVTHTGPMNNYVEIGITPYNEENAEFLYKTFGREIVKVVEGQQAVTMGIEAGNGNTAELYSVNNASTEAKEVSEMVSPILIALACTVGAVIVLGGTVIVTRRRKISSR